MRRALNLLARTFDISLSVMLIYRANIVFFLLFEGMFLGAQFLTVKVGFALAGTQIAGWTESQAYVLTAVNGLTHQLFICFFINSIFSLSTWVWNGQFDYVLLKPLHPLLSMFANGQFIVSNLPTLLVNAGAVVYFLWAGDTLFSLATLAPFVVFVLAGLAVRVALALICSAPIFFSERMTDVEDTFWSIASLGRYPLAIYPRMLSSFLTFVLPVGMMASLPSSLLFGRESAAHLTLALAAAVAFALAGGWIFMRCLRFYQSVNSGV